MNHSTKYLPLFPYNSLSQIPLIYICIWEVYISILENNPLCSCLHQILISKKSNSLSIQKHDLIFSTNHGNRIRSRHIIKFPFYNATAATVKCLTGNFFPICKKMGFLNIPHSNPKSLYLRRHSQFLALSFQKFRNL